MHHRVLLVLLLAAIGGGCGEDDRSNAAEDPDRRAFEFERGYAFYSKHPRAMTCRHVLAIHSAKAQQFHIAALSLAREVRLPGTNRNQLWQRFVYALLDLCKKRDDLSYRPAAEAVRRVRNGEYLLRGDPPQHREDRRRAREP